MQMSLSKGTVQTNCTDRVYVVETVYACNETGSRGGSTVGTSHG